VESTPSSAENPATYAGCAAKLAQLFPALFGGGYKPLKLRIQTDIQERAPGVFSKQALSAFLSRHTGSTGYLVAMTKATHRFNLDGAPAGEISEVHREAARQELARRRANVQAKAELAEEGRRKRAALLRDFETTTLTPQNFCALKGIAPAELERLLDIARRERDEARQRAHEPRPGPRPPRPAVPRGKTPSAHPKSAS
jgi:sRNA-binding protein